MGCRGEKPKGHTMEDRTNFNNINEKDLNAIKHEFMKIYNSLATINYCKGGTVGRAQQKALDQMSSFINTKTTQKHPMNEYLKKLDSENRKTMSEYIMKSSFSNDVFNDAVAAKQWGKMAETELKSSLVKFNDIYRKYPAVQQDNTKNVQPNEQQKQRLIQMYLQMVRQKTREARSR